MAGRAAPGEPMQCCQSPYPCERGPWQSNARCRVPLQPPALPGTGSALLRGCLASHDSYTSRYLHWLRQTRQICSPRQVPEFPNTSTRCSLMLAPHASYSHSAGIFTQGLQFSTTSSHYDSRIRPKLAQHQAQHIRPHCRLQRSHPMPCKR